MSVSELKGLLLSIPTRVVRARKRPLSILGPQRPSSAVALGGLLLVTKGVRVRDDNNI